jgi:hypothetical protein
VNAGSLPNNENEISNALQKLKYVHIMKLHEINETYEIVK